MKGSKTAGPDMQNSRHHFALRALLNGKHTASIVSSLPRQGSATR